MIKIEHVTYNWERNACDTMLTDSGRVNSEKINLNSLIDRFGNMFLTHCYKTVLYVQFGDNGWKIIIPFNEETLNAFIFQDRGKYISIYQQTSHFYVHEKKCFNVVKLDTEAMIEEMSDEVKNKLSTKHKLSYGNNYVGSVCKSVDKSEFGNIKPNAFGTISTKASTNTKSNAFANVTAKAPTKAPIKQIDEIPTKPKTKVPASKFAKVPTKSIVDKSVKPIAVTTASSVDNSVAKQFDNVTAKAPTKSVVDIKPKTQSKVSIKVQPKKEIVWEIQEDWD